MFAKAGSEFKCDVTDISCLCKDINFGYGLHDCGIENCKDNSVANLIIDWGRQLCAQAGVTINVPSASGNVSAFVFLAVGQPCLTVCQGTGSGALSSSVVPSNGSVCSNRGQTFN